MRGATRDGVMEAAGKIAAIVPPTPLISLQLNGHALWCKAEALQPIGAFKLRGAWHRLTAIAPADRTAGVVAFSSGNHAQGIAWAAQRLGMPALIVMPADAPAKKLAATRALGAEIVTYDRHRESREEIAARIATERGAVLVPSFDDPWVVEGQGSTGVEIAAQLAERGHPGPARIVIPCGGGGLAAGIALACPDAEIIVVEPEGWDDMARSLAGGQIVPVAPDAPYTACDALQTRQVAPITFDVLKARGARGVAVSEAEVETAIRFAFDHFRIVLEPGGAVALAAALAAKAPLGGGTVLVLSGGNIDAQAYARIIAKGAD